ncbi:MEKHLA domain-containing protein [Listeria cornellensis]|uniref:PAS domain-containing protein n=1 Tax=Listeria cornellensis FSL F6-0969 TaxID=1265820 RepID=W7C2Y9_9LIST|nr:MEKHLA domain-containing protein [Listeria cornellensis]EUJ31605.1 hypothetical protein PCORN_04682 [Listeria cornellensis FSL F6-0969]
MNEKERYQMLCLVEQSYKHWTEEQLPTPLLEKKDRLRWLDEQSPYGLLVQNTNAEPFFIYANKQAQNIFGYNLEEFLSIPSRKSAPPQKQKDRNLMLENVAMNGISTNYYGTRIDKQGKLFEIEKGIIWKLINESGALIGTAALIYISKV